MILTRPGSGKVLWLRFQGRCSFVVFARLLQQINTGERGIGDHCSMLVLCLSSGKDTFDRSLQQVFRLGSSDPCMLKVLVVPSMW